MGTTPARFWSGRLWRLNAVRIQELADSCEAQAVRVHPENPNNGLGLMRIDFLIHSINGGPTVFARPARVQNRDIDVTV